MTENQKAIYLTNLFNAKYKILGHEEANIEVNVDTGLKRLKDVIQQQEEAKEQK